MKINAADAIFNQYLVMTEHWREATLKQMLL